MERCNLDKFYAENTGLIHDVARKGYGRLQAIGASEGYEDLVQELSITFIKAYEQFEPERGEFSTYFVRSAYNRMNKIAAEFELERCEAGVRSFEEIDALTDCEDASFLDVIASNVLTPEQVAINRSMLERLDKILSPLAREIALWIVVPPEFVGSELNAHQAHVDYARSKGHERRNKTHLGMSFICDMMELIGIASKVELRQARLELQAAIEKEYSDV